MRLSIASYLLLIIAVCFLIQFELVRLQEGITSTKDISEVEEQACELYELYENIWKDLVYFPIPESTENEEAVVSYENSWMFERTYGGTYGHEGTDLMAGLQEPGYYPVVSISDGVVEKVGWLEKGGWRTEFEVFMMYISIMPTWILMRRSGSPETLFRPDSFWALWGIPAMEKQRVPEESFRCICISAFTYGPKKFLNWQ